MNAIVALTMTLLAVVMINLTVGPTTAPAQPAREAVLLTSGVVKHVDLDARTIVLENGRKLRPRAILLNDEWVDLSAVQPQDSIVLSGIDLGHEEVQASVVPRSR